VYPVYIQSRLIFCGLPNSNYKAELKSSGDETSPWLAPFWIANASKMFLYGLYYRVNLNIFNQFHQCTELNENIVQYFFRYWTLHFIEIYRKLTYSPFFSLISDQCRTSD
jgi:hypothetical protein